MAKDVEPDISEEVERPAVRLRCPEVSGIDQSADEVAIVGEPRVEGRATCAVVAHDGEHHPFRLAQFVQQTPLHREDAANLCVLRFAEQEACQHPRVKGAGARDAALAAPAPLPSVRAARGYAYRRLPVSTSAFASETTRL